MSKRKTDAEQVLVGWHDVSSELQRALRKVNGTDIPQPERYEPARTEIRNMLEKVIVYCDQIEGVLTGVENVGSRNERKYRSVSDRVKRISEIVGAQNREMMRRDRRFKVLATSGFDTGAPWKLNVLPPNNVIFRLGKLILVPEGDIREQLYWSYYRGIADLDDLRRIRKCSGPLHEGPFYFIRKRLERRESCFCSDQCRSAFNYDKKLNTERGHTNGRKRKTTSTRR